MTISCVQVIVVKQDIVCMLEFKVGILQVVYWLICFIILNS